MNSDTTTIRQPEARRVVMPGVFRCGCGSIVDDPDFRGECADCIRDRRA